MYLQCEGQWNYCHEGSKGKAETWPKVEGDRVDQVVDEGPDHSTDTLKCTQSGVHSTCKEINVLQDFKKNE